MGERGTAVDHSTLTRMRGSETVPHIVHKIPLRQPQSIFEIVVGPAAPADSEHGVQTMLHSLGADGAVIGETIFQFHKLERGAAASLFPNGTRSLLS
jgi:hypothetical protein